MTEIAAQEKIMLLRISKRLSAEILVNIFDFIALHLFWLAVNELCLICFAIAFVHFIPATHQNAFQRPSTPLIGVSTHFLPSSSQVNRFVIGMGAEKEPPSLSIR